MRRKLFTIMVLWLWFYIVDFVRQERSLWVSPLYADQALIITRIIHLSCMVLGFIGGITVTYPRTNPPVMVGTMLIAFIGGALGYVFVRIAKMDEANEPMGFDTGHIFGTPIYRPRRLFKRYEVQEEMPSITYEAKPWCDLAAWFILASFIRVIAFLIFHQGTI